MKTYLDCIPCFLSQALRSARIATNDVSIQRKVIDAVSCAIPELPLDITPPEIARRIYNIVHDLTGNSDPYKEIKEQSNQMALSRYPKLKQMVDQAKDPLLAACKLAIAGNVIDFGPQADYGNLDVLIESSFTSPLAIDHYEAFKTNVERASRILYLGDNAGEVLFDRILIQQIGRNTDLEVVFVVREKPIINDATLDDALSVGLDRLATIISNGSDAPATILPLCSSQMLKQYDEADLVISKGQGNYESLNEAEHNIFFMLKAKCSVIAELLEVDIGDSVLLNPGLPTRRQSPCD
ncbi:MAG: DUF89 family protein [Proteobacteria bacterium]|nr:DUF89 family protein [Pseudomonadota bacterium]